MWAGKDVSARKKQEQCYGLFTLGPGLWPAKEAIKSPEQHSAGLGRGRGTFFNSRGLPG